MSILTDADKRHFYTLHLSPNQAIDNDLRKKATKADYTNIRNEMALFWASTYPYTWERSLECTDVVEWWKGIAAFRSEALPVASVVEMLYTAGVNAASNERMNSVCGIIHTKRKNRLSCNRMKQLATVRNYSSQFPEQ